MAEDLKKVLAQIREAQETIHESWLNEITALRAEAEALKAEKERRIYYQHIVYKVCNLLDAYQQVGHVVCGCLEEPSTETQDFLREVLRRKTHPEIKSLKAKLAKCVGALEQIDIKAIRYFAGTLRESNACSTIRTIARDTLKGVDGG